MKPVWRDATLLTLLTAVLFSLNITGYDLWPPDEPRYAEAAREMIETGDYTTPRVNGEPYREKPPLLFWSIAGFSHLTGETGPLAARLPSVIAGIVTVLLAYALALRLYDRRTAVWTALLLITCQRIWWQARFGQIDMLLTACLTFALYAFARWRENPRGRWLFLFYLSCSAALYAKGPGVLVFPVLPLVTVYWRRWRDLVFRTHFIDGFVCAVLLYTLWLIPARMGGAAIEESTASGDIFSNLFRQTLGRFGGVSHANWPWYYLKTLAVDWLPWTLFLPWTLPWIWKRRREGGGMTLLLCWIVPAFIFFSIAIGKRAVYLLPLFPAMAILQARALLALMESDRGRLRRAIGLIWGLLLAVLAAAPFVLRYTDYAEAWHPSLLAVSAVAAAGALLSFAAAATVLNRRLHQVMAVTFMGVAVVTPLFIFPVINSWKSAKSFCAPIRRLAESDREFDLYSVGFAREEYIFYAHHFHEELFTDLLELETMADLSLWEKARLQESIHRGFIKALDETEIHPFEELTAADIGALQSALDTAMESDRAEPAMQREFREVLARECAQHFDAIVTEHVPALFMVQAKDWRLMLALHPPARHLHIRRHEEVGRREVLLLANDAGAALLQADQ
jgi:4-amino-4-deoxy-L-arabinose transferase-like glycosyltransferase